MAARSDDGRVVFVRHGLPGERVVARLTDVHATWARADAVEVLDPSPERVAPPCPFFAPGACGGCDYQHATVAAQRGFKATRLGDQLRRVAGLDLAVDVEAVGEGDGLSTRTRVRYAVTTDTRLALRVHRRHDLVEVDRCRLGVVGLEAATSTLLGELALDAHHAGRAGPVELEAIRLGEGPATVLERQGSRHPRRARVVVGPTRQEVVVEGRRHEVSPASFWQVHRAAPAVLSAAVRAAVALSGGEQVLDLYCGAGLFTALLATEVGPRGRVVGLDASTSATADAARALRPWPWARVETGRVDHEGVASLLDGVTHVVLDPPRAGVDRGALLAIAASPRVRRVVYVSCEPSTLARDLDALTARGLELVELRALDLFEMTEHLECVAVLDRSA